MSTPTDRATRVRTAALRARGITRTYGTGPTATRALQGIDLDLTPGTLTVVAGRSGSGKTTLLNCLTGLDRPDTGTVHLGDTDITALDDQGLLTLRREAIGFVFQTFGLLPVLTARENIGLPLRLHRTPVPERETRVADLLELVGLTDHAEQHPGELSGGQQQRVALARALITDPALLVADEPTGQLDTRTGHQVMDLVTAITRERGTTTLIASHDPDLIARADRVLHMTDGRLDGSHHAGRRVLTERAPQ